jgi:chitinase
MNQFRGIASTGAARADNGDKLRRRAGEICAPAARRRPNFVSVDYVELPDHTPRNLVADLNR